jgi:hypothetical protein
MKLNWISAKGQPPKRTLFAVWFWRKSAHCLSVGVSVVARVTTKSRISQKIDATPGEILLRSSFVDTGTPSRITRAINALIAEGKMIRLGYGVYAKARPSSLTGNPIPRKTLEELTPEIFKQLDVTFEYGKAITEYISGKSTQVPTALIISTGSRRINRRISLGLREVKYEKNIRRTNSPDSGSKR